jgi:hypothetical protein
MSETTTETPAETPSTETPEQTPTEQPVAKSFTQDDVNAMLAKQKREQFGDYGDLKAKAAKLTEIEESQRTEAEKVAARAAAAEQERDAARTESLRYKAAAKFGVDEDNFDLLGAGAEEEVQARAERVGGFLKLAAENQQLKAELEALRTGRPVQQQPVEHLRPGASPVAVTPVGEADYPAHWFPKRTGPQSGT